MRSFKKELLDILDLTTDEAIKAPIIGLFDDLIKKKDDAMNRANGFRRRHALNEDSLPNMKTYITSRFTALKDSDLLHVYINTNTFSASVTQRPKDAAHLVHVGSYSKPFEKEYAFADLEYELSLITSLGKG
jgi:hypothetical protein